MIDFFFKIAKENPEGFTISIETLKHVTKGYVVSYEETQNSYGKDGLTRVVAHAEKHEKIIGGWLNEANSLYYFDSNRVFYETKEAIDFGVEQHQISIFYLDDQQLIKIVTKENSTVKEGYVAVES